MSIIVVNATALDQSGALTILKQFIEAVPLDKFEYLIFISNKVNITYTQQNINLVQMIGVKSFRKRFLWDAFGLKKWLSSNNIVPIATISLQNTNFRVNDKISNYIYYHQSIPFFKQNWSLLKSEERPLWFYKNIYPFFINLFLNKRTEVFVQLEFIKSGFAKKFNFPKEKIHVIAPKITIPPIDCILNVELDKDKINLFYPATPFFYKNHKIILQALSSIKKSKFVLYLTCKENELDEEWADVDIRFMGVVSFEKVLGMYAKVDALLFPSYIETYGLPLLEAASFGTPILATDLPYSREVLNTYEGVQYITHTDAGKWADAMLKLQKGKKYNPYTLPDTKSWGSLFEILTRNL